MGGLTSNVTLGMTEGVHRTVAGYLLLCYFLGELHCVDNPGARGAQDTMKHDQDAFHALVVVGDDYLGIQHTKLCASSARVHIDYECANLANRCLVGPI
jgi:hypothetical protein